MTGHQEFIIFKLIIKLIEIDYSYEGIVQYIITFWKCGDIFFNFTSKRDTKQVSSFGAIDLSFDGLHVIHDIFLLHHQKNCVRTSIFFSFYLEVYKNKFKNLIWPSKFKFSFRGLQYTCKQRNMQD